MRFFLYLLLAAALLLGGGAHAQEFSGAQVSSANMVRGAASSTSNTAVTLIAAPATGVRLYITGLQCYNSGATTSTITLNDSGAWEGVNPTISGFAVVFSTPLVMAAATALTFTPGSSSSTQFCNAQGYLGS